MAVTLDETTLAAYQAQSEASLRAGVVVAALTGTVLAKVYDGTGTLRASGTMAAPWATASGATITVGELNGAGLTVTSGGVPDASWYAQFRSGSRFVRGTFGVAGSGRDFTWSLATFATGSRGTVGTVVLTAMGSGVTAPVLTTSPSLSVFDGAVGQAGSLYIVSPGRYQNDRPLNDYPLQLRHTLQKDGVDQAGRTGLAHALDGAGTWRVKEEAFRVGEPLNIATNFTSPVVITGTRDPALVYANDITWLGAFQLPYPQAALNDSYAFPYPANGLAFNPTGNGGAGSLFVVGHVARPQIGEVSIPATLGASEASIPSSVLLSGSVLRDPIEGQLATSGIEGGTDNALMGLLVEGGRLLVTGANNYAVTQSHSWFWRRPLDLSVTGSVDGPFAVADYARGFVNWRHFAGYMANVPTTLVGGLNPQVALGGPVLAGLVGDSIVSNASDGPALLALDPANFTTNAGKCRRGTVVAASGSSVTLDAGASTTTGFYVGCYIGQQTQEPNSALRITAYNGTTRTATVDGTTAMTAGSAYFIAAGIQGSALTTYANGQLQASVSQTYAGIWNWTGSCSGIAVPNGTRSVLAFGSVGHGIWEYGAQDEVINGMKIYDPSTADGRGERAFPYQAQVWAYDLLDLQSSRTGATTPGSVKPYAVWQISAPFNATSSISGVAYDPATRRLFVRFSLALPYGNPVIHVYRVNNAVAA